MSYSLKILIVDDERQSCALIKKLVQQFHSDSEVKEAYTITDALAALNDHQPDLIFLDIQMRGETGFDLLDRTKIDSQVIFITAHSEYALKAFRYSAIDYLLKPLDIQEFEQALAKASKRTRNPENFWKQLEFLQEFRSKAELPEKLTIPTAEGFLFVTISDILYCQAIGNYTQFHLKSNQKSLSSRTLGYYEDTLQNHNFFRMHRSYLVNMAQITMYKKGDGGTVVMSNGDELEVARSQKETILKLLAC